MPEKENKEKSKGRALVDEHLAFVYAAGHGEVLIKVADGVIVHIESKATQDLTKEDREK